MSSPDDAPSAGPSTDDLRTEWSEDRTLMASERTYNSALGTALGCIGVSLGLHAVFTASDPAWLPKAVASLFLAIALFLIWAARARAVRTRKRLHEHMAHSEGSTSINATTIFVSLAILALGVVLWTV